MIDFIKDNGYQLETTDDMLEPSRTHQSFRDECDINKIMSKWKSTGVINHVTTARGVYGDFSSAVDFHSQLQRIEAAQEAFDMLPSEVRNRMDNDPATLIDFLGDSGNRDEAIELGLIDGTEDVLPTGAQPSLPLGGESRGEGASDSDESGGEIPA